MDRRLSSKIGAAAVIAAGAAAPLTAQIPATPVLQNAWTNAGVTAAVDYGHAQGATAWAGAIAWSPRQARFQLSLGGGVVNDSIANRGAYGARLAIPIIQFAGGSISTAVFGGVGYAAQSGMRESNFPVGASVGFRHALGTTRGISLYAAPFWMLTRAKASADSVGATHGLFRASVGLDVTLASQVGLTLGYEGGATASGVDPGARGGVFGVALSYALRRQQ